MKKWIGWALVLVLTGIGFRANAVIIAGGDGTGNTNGTGVIGWDYVGRIQSANNAPSSVTYVGSGWFITAYHVKYYDNPTGVVLNATSYSIDPATWTRITNSTGTDADLILFRVAGTIPPLSDPVIASSSPANGTALVMIGGGRNREASPTFWDASWVVTNDASATYTGYVWAAGSTKRWGTNVISGKVNALDDGYGTNRTYYTTFDNHTNEAQGATYDSGGGVFTGTTNSWALSGIMITESGHAGQPESTSVLGNRTYVADLSSYRTQILDTIPEPASVVFVLAGAFSVFGLRRWYRQGRM